MSPIGKKRIITHRGLEPSRQNFFSESSLEAFADQLSRGFGGIEFDPNPTKDGIIVMHDANLSRPTNGKDNRLVSEVGTIEVVKILLPNGHIPKFEQVMGLIRKSNSAVNSLHLKARLQTPRTLKRIMGVLSENEDIFPKLLVFDVKPKIAQILKQAFPNLRLAPSIAHPHDIKRFGKSVGSTLITIEQALELRKKGLIDGVWADEWDTQGPSETKKQFYTKENFVRLHSAGLFVAVVTPELHGTSPGLYGGESHEDSRDLEKLFARVKQIKNAGADYFCTDYPEEVARL